MIHVRTTEGTIKPGDIFTIAGDYEEIVNPARKWWTPWRPKRVKSLRLRTWKVI